LPKQKIDGTPRKMVAKTQENSWKTMPGEKLTSGKVRKGDMKDSQRSIVRSVSKIPNEEISASLKYNLQVAMRSRARCQKNIEDDRCLCFDEETLTIDLNQTYSLGNARFSKPKLPSRRLYSLPILCSRPPACPPSPRFRPP